MSGRRSCSKQLSWLMALLVVSSITFAGVPVVGAESGTEPLGTPVLDDGDQYELNTQNPESATPAERETEPTETLAGTVDDGNRDPIENAEITLVEQHEYGDPTEVEDGFTTTGTTDVDGRYELAVVEGVFMMWVDHPHFESEYRQNIVVEGGEAKTYDPIEMTAYEAMVNGTVTDADTGDPLEAVAVESRFYVDNVYSTTATNDTGWYEVGVPDDQGVTIQYAAEGYDSELIEVDGSATENVSLTPVGKMGTLSATVTNAIADEGTVEPIEGAFVGVSAGLDFVSSDVTGPDGQVDFELPTGTYVLEIEAAGYEDEFVDAVEVEAGETTTTAIELTPSDDDAPDSGISVTDRRLSQDLIQVGTNVTVTATVENTGDSTDTLDLSVGVDGIPFYEDSMEMDVDGEATEGPISVTVDPDETKQVDTDLTFNEEMESTPITVNGVGAGELTVVDSTPAQIVITEPGVYELDGDLSSDTSDTFVVIDADDVVLDGNGYTLANTAGSGTAVGTGAVENVTVRNLTVENWEFGIEFERVETGAIENVTAGNQSETGIGLVESSDVSISDVNSTNNSGHGIHLNGVTDAELRHVAALYNEDTGIQLDGSSDNTIDHVVTHGSKGWHGIELDSSHRNTISNVSTQSNARDGITVKHSNDNVIENSSSEYNGQVGLRIADSIATEVYDSAFRHNSWRGVSLEPNPVGSSNGADRSTLVNVISEENDGPGINIVQSTQNTIEGATIQNNDGIGLNLMGSSWNTVEDAVVDENSRGILVGADMATSDGDSNYNSFVNVSMRGNDRESVMITDDGDFSNPSPSVGNEFEALTIGNYTTLSVQGQMIELYAVDEPPAPPLGKVDVEQAVEIVPESGGQISSLAFHYDDSPDWEFDETDLELWRHDDGVWIDESEQQTFDQDNTVTIEPGTQFGTFAPLLPDPFAVTNASLNVDEVVEGDSVTVTATVENDGESSGNMTVPLEVDGTVVDEQTITLDAGESADVEFTYVFDEPGEFDVSVGGVQAGTVTVLASADVIFYGADVDETEVSLGDTVTVTGDMYNSGDVSEDVTVSLTTDGEVVAETTVTVEPGTNPGLVAVQWTPSTGDIPTDEDSVEVSLGLNGFFVDTVTVVDHFSDIQVIAASTADTELIEGEETHVIGSIYQAGNVEGTEEIELTATHTETGKTEVVSTQNVTLSPGFYHLGALNISFVPEEPGHYDLELGGTNAGWVDVEEAVTDIQVIAASTADTELIEGEETHVIGSIYQAGNIEGTEEIELTATHNVTGKTEVVGSQNVTLSPGFYHLGALNISFTPDEPGHYDLQLGGTNAGWVDVEEAVTDIQVIAASTADTELIEGEATHVIGSIYQAGNIEGTEEIELTATHNVTGETHVVGSQNVTLSPGFYHLGALNISFTPDEPGHYDLQLGGTNAGWVDVEEAVTDIQVIAASTADTELIEGEETHVIGSIYQAGNIEGTEEIELTATHNETGKTEVVGSQNVTLSPGFYHLGALNISFTPDEPGHYDLELGGTNAGWVDVEEAVTDIQVIAASTAETELIEGEETHVIGSIYQAGNIEGTEEIELTATHNVTGKTEVVGSQNVTLSPGFYHLGALNISFTPDEPGHYDLQLGGTNAGWVDVEEAVTDIQVIAASASDVEISENEETYVVGSVYQAGNIEGTEEIELTATHEDGTEAEVVGSQNVTLAPGFYHLGALNVTFAPEQTGNYTLELGGTYAGTVYVEEVVTDIQVIAASVQDIELIEGEETYVIGSVYQNGSDTATEEIELTATHNETGETEVVDSQNVTLSPGFYHLGALNITFAPDEPGHYDLELGGRNAGFVEVEPAVSDIQVIAASGTESDLIEGEETHVIGSIYQAGNVEGTEEIELTATHNETGKTEVVGSQNVTLSPGFYHLGALNISFVPEEPGHYDLELGGMNAGWVDVEPAESDIQVIAASAGESELIEGEETHVIGSIYQAGNIEGTEEIELTATHNVTGETHVVDSQEVTLSPGFYHLGALNISFTPDEPGHYDLQLGGTNAGWVDVEPAESDIQVIAASGTESELIEGEKTHVIGSIYQAGNIEGTEEIELTATHNETGNTEVVSTQNVTLSPGFYHLGALNISFTPDEPGHYDLELGEMNAGWVDVEPAESDIQVIAASATESNIAYGQETYAIGSIYQAGNIEGTEEIELTATHNETGETEVVGTQNVTLSPGFYHLGALNVSFVPEEPGHYDLELGGMNAGWIEVSEPVVEPTIVSVDGNSAETDPATGHDVVYANEDASVEIDVEADLDLETVTLLVDSLETTYTVPRDATHDAGNTWTADVPFEHLPDDGKYALSVIAVDDLGHAGTVDANETLVIDREDPTLSVSLDDVDSDDATLVIESDVPLAEFPDVDVNVADLDDLALSASSGPVATLTDSNAENTTFTGTLEFDGTGEYTVDVTGTDRAGNEGNASTSVVHYDFTLGDDEIVIEGTGVTIVFDVVDDANAAIKAESLAMALAENADDANLDGGALGVGFLSTELPGLLDVHLEGATIEMAIDESDLQAGADIGDVELHYYDGSAGQWEAVDSTVDYVDDDPYLVADVTHFSTYGALVVDETPPALVSASPTDGAVLDANTESVEVRFEYEDDLSGVDVRSISLSIDGIDVTADEGTQITSSEATHDLTADEGESYTATVTVADRAGNAETYETSFAVEDSGDDPAPRPPRSPDPDPSPDVTVVDVEPRETTIPAGSTVEFTATLENVGEVTGEHEVRLSLKDTTVDSETITVAAGETSTVTLSYGFDKPGTYLLSIGEYDLEMIVEVDDSDESEDAGDGDESEDADEHEDEQDEADEAGSSDDEEDGAVDESDPGVIDDTDDDTIPGFGAGIAIVAVVLGVVLFGRRHF